MHWLLVYLYVFDVSFLLAIFLTPLCRKLSYQWGMVDHPDEERKGHTQPIPLLGGLSIGIAFFLNVVLNYAGVLPFASHIDLPFLDYSELRTHVHGALAVWPKLTILLLGGMLMVGLGIYDDKYRMRAIPKLAGQVLVASIVALGGMRITLFVNNPAINFLFTIVWIVTITNAMNFLDNMDGLCAGVGLICALLFGLVAAIQHQYFVCVLAVAFGGSLLGFLPYNFKTATIFLGDSGSHLVGYILAVLPVIGTFYQPGTPTFLPVLIPLLVLAVPLFDMAMVTWIRLRKKKPIHIGDANHISHRLVRLGLPESWAVTLIYLIVLTLGLGATVLLWSDITASLIVIVQSISVLAIVTLLEQFGAKQN